MKITIVQGAFLPVPPILGGAVEKMWFALGKAFAQKGHDVIHLSRQCNGTPDEEWIDGVFHRRLQGYATPSSGLRLKLLDLRYSLRAASAIPSDSDIVVTNTFWAPLVLSKKLKRRCVVDVQRMPKGQMRWYKQPLRLRANSTPVADAIKKEISHERYPQVKTIPNPLPFHSLPDVDLAAKQKIVLYAGRVHPEKGLELLLQAFKNAEPSWQLKIVGPSAVEAGGGGQDYLQQLRDLAGNAAIEFTGPVFDMERLNDLYKQASVFAYPSVAEGGETFGLAPLEAMAWGCVPVVSNLRCFQDFITNGRNGLIFDHRSPDAVELLTTTLLQLQNDAALRASLAGAALAVRKSHSLSSIAAAFLEDFAQIIHHGKK